MPRSLPVVLLLTFALAGCVAVNRRDRDLLESHGVAGPVYEKMMHHEPLTLDDIVELSRKGVLGPFIVHYLRPTYYVYQLKAGDVMRLRQSGVPEGVIRYLLATPAMFSPGRVPVWYENDPHMNDWDWDWRRY